MRKTIRLAIFSMALAGAGCNLGSKSSTDEFSNATPESSAYTLEVTGDAASEGLTTSSVAGDGAVGSTSQALTGTIPEYLRHTRDAVKALNAGVLAVLEPVQAAIAAEAQKPAGDVRVWVKDQGTVTYRFAMKKTADKEFAWVTEAKVQGSDDATYVKVMGGLFHQGDTAHRGRGGMGIDLSKLA